MRCTFGENPQIHYSISIVNSGHQPADQLSIHADHSLPLIPWDPPCFIHGVPYHVTETIHPGEQMTIIDSTNFFPNTSRAILKFYIVAHNLRLHANEAVISAEVDFTTSSAQIDRARFKIFPNPATGQVRIETPSSIERNGLLSIYNINGVKVKEMDFNGKVIDLPTLSSGIYVLHSFKIA